KRLKSLGGPQSVKFLTAQAVFGTGMAIDVSDNPADAFVAEEFEGDEALGETESGPTADDAARLAAALGLEFIPILPQVDPPRELIFGEFSRIIGSWGKQFKAVPLGRENGEITVAVSDPLRIEVADILRLCYGCDVKIVV